MPSLYCHYISGAQVLEKLNSARLRSLLESHRDAFNLGTQGPDIFSYRDAWPFKRKSSVDGIGSRLHEDDVQGFFQKSAEYIKNMPMESRDILTAYIMGYACHYALDSISHPYIFYKSGFAVSDSDSELKYKSDHRQFETALDVLITRLVLKKTTNKINPARLVAISRRSACDIADMYSWILREIYEISAPASDILSAIAAIEKIQRILFDRSGAKKKLIRSVESLFGLPPVISSMIHPETVEPDIDYLNSSNDIWRMPWDCESSRYDSFVDLFESAISMSSALMEEFYIAVSNQGFYEFPKSKWNSSFLSGLDCEMNVVFNCFDSVYED